MVLDGQAVTLEVPVLHLPMVTGSGASLLGQNWLPLNLNHAHSLGWTHFYYAGGNFLKKKLDIQHACLPGIFQQAIGQMDPSCIAMYMDNTVITGEMQT